MSRKIEENETIRNNSLDILKAICAFLVVCIHIKFPGKIGEYVNIIAAVAVPIFFMITGFYWNKISKNNKIDIHIKKIIKLLIGTILIYIIYNVGIRIISKANVEEYFTKIFNLKSGIKFLFFNEVETIGHVWYLGSILYIMILAKYLLNKKYTKKVMRYFLPIAFIIYIIIGKYSKLIFGVELPYYLRRNCFLMGIPYFYTGYLINENKDRITITNKSLIMSSIFLVVVTFIEKYMLESWNLNTMASNYIGISILPITVFILAIKNPCFLIGNNIAIIGRKYSTLIYVLHPLIIGMIDNVIQDYHIEWVAPFITYLITLFVAVAINKTIERKKKNEYNLFQR